MTSSRMLLISAGLLCAVLLSACDSTSAPVERVTIAPTVAGAGAPIYTATASLTPSNTPTVTPTATDTPTPTATLTPTATNTPTDTPTPTATHTPPPSSTPDLMTPSPAPRSDVPAVQINSADMSPAEGWSCGDFPCADDLDGWLERIQVPRGFSVSPVGQFPGQVMQIAYGADERLYATVLEDGTRSGAVYALNADGTFERFSETLLMPLGLAFQPGTDVLYVTSRRYDDEYNVERGALWRILSDGTQQLVRDDLPCCYLEIGNQPNGLIFGADGWLYVGIGALTDRGESPNPRGQAYADIQPREAAILRLNPHTGDIEPYAQGLRNTWDIALDSRGNLYATDTGLVTGEGDRLITVTEDGFYGWPYYRNRGCADCPPSRGAGQPLPDLVTFPNYSLPRGLVSYNGAQFPQNMQDTLFVTLWNGTPYAQRVVWIDPRDNRLNTDEYTPQAFVTGLIRPTDVTVAPDGSLVVADFIYGHVWRISYEPSVALPTVGETPEFSATQIGPFQPIGTPPAPFATNTPAN